MPCDSNTWSPAPCPFSSIIRPYWNPEQPPPCTNTRRPLPALFSSVKSSEIFEAAVSDTLIIAIFLPEVTHHYSKKRVAILHRLRAGPAPRPATAQALRDTS